MKTRLDTTAEAAALALERLAEEVRGVEGPIRQRTLELSIALADFIMCVDQHKPMFRVVP